MLPLGLPVNAAGTLLVLSTTGCIPLMPFAGQRSEQQAIAKALRQSTCQPASGCTELLVVAQ